MKRLLICLSLSLVLFSCSSYVPPPDQGSGSYDQEPDDQELGKRLPVKAGLEPVRTIHTAPPLMGGGLLSKDLFLNVSIFSPRSPGVVPQSGGGNTNYLRADGIWAAPSGGGGGISAINVTAPVTSTGGSSPTIGVNDFGSSTRGTVPSSGGGSTNFLRADGTWAAPPGGVSGGTTGDLTSWASSTSLTSYAGSSCSADKAAISEAATGALTCQYFFDSAGTGLTSSSNSVSLNINGGSTQTCSSGQAVTSVTGAGIDSCSAFVNAIGASTGLSLAGSTISDVQFGTSTNGYAPSSGGGTTNFLRADGTWAAPPGSAISGLTTNDLVIAASSSSVTNYAGSDPGACTSGQADTHPALSVTGALTSSCAAFVNAVGASTGLSLTGSTISGVQFNSTTNGYAPSSGGGTTNFLRADGTWAAPPGGGGGGGSPAVAASHATFSAGVNLSTLGTIDWVKCSVNTGTNPLSAFGSTVHFKLNGGWLFQTLTPIGNYTGATASDLTYTSTASDDSKLVAMSDSGYCDLFSTSAQLFGFYFKVPSDTAQRKIRLYLVLRQDTPSACTISTTATLSVSGTTATDSITATGVTNQLVTVTYTGGVLNDELIVHVINVTPSGSSCVIAIEAISLGV